MNRYLSYLAAIGVLSILPSIAGAKVPEWPSPPDLPTVAQTPVWTASPENRMVERLPAKAKEFEDAFAKLIKQSPEKLGLPPGVTLHIDSVQLSPEADGIPPMAFVHLTERVEGTPVAGTDTSFVVQWSTPGSPLRISAARLFPDLKKLPQKALTKEEAERKVWEKLSGEITRFDTSYGGVWVRWLDGQWRTIQLFGVTPQGVLAAVDGDGKVFSWPGHVSPVIEVKKPKAPERQ